MKTKTYVGCLIAAALVAVAFLMFPYGPDNEPIPAQVVTEPNLFPFVKSFADTRPDGDAKVAPDDVLVVDVALRNLFEYYLAAIGEKSIDEIRIETERELDRKLKPLAATEAKRLLGRYLDYKRALLDVAKNQQLSGNAGATVRGRILAMQQVRTRYFSAAETAGLFGFDDAYDLDAVARLEISQDTNLTLIQKQAKIAALDAALAPALREARDAPMIVVRLEESVTKMRENGASDDEIYRMRAAAVSPEAAARLAEVDREEATWKNRINTYLDERKRVVAANSSSSGTMREAALAQLRQARFSEDEQKRLAAYE